MRAAVFCGPRCIEVADRRDPVVAAPTDAVVRVVRSAPVRRYIPELLDDVLQGRIKPGLVFDFETDLDGVADAYRAMDERRAIKSLLRIGTL